MTAKKLLAIAACCIAHSHVAQGAANYQAFVQDKVVATCVTPQPLTKSDGGIGFTKALIAAYLHGPCVGGAAAQSAYAASDVIFNPASIGFAVRVSGGGAAESNSVLTTVVTLRGPATATKVHVVEGLTVIGPVALSGSSSAQYSPCIVVTQGATVLGETGCSTPIPVTSNVSKTWEVTVTVPAVGGRAQFNLNEYIVSVANSSISTPPAQSAYFHASIYPLQHIIESGWTYTAAGNFKPRP